MNIYIQHLKEKLENQHPNYGHREASGILDMLYYEYAAENPVENDEIHAEFESLDKILSKLSLEENDAVFLKTVNLCLQYEKAAFLSGVHVGVRLFTELSD